MARLLTLAVLLLCLFSSKAQTSSITAGQITGMIHTVYQPGPLAIQVPEYDYGLVQQQQDFDLDKDGITDFSIIVSFDHISAGAQYWNISLSMSPACYVRCLIDTYTVQQGCTGYTGYGDTVWHPVVKNFFYGNNIYNSADTLWQSGTIELQDFGGHCSTSLLQDFNTGGSNWQYHFFKLIKGTDTLLAYARFSEATVDGRGHMICYISDYAIQGTQNTINIPTAIATPSADNFKIYPIPFSNEINMEATNNGTYNIYAVTGALLLSGKGNKVNTQALPAGSYILEVSSNNSTVRRVVVKVQ
jgi:Secretion system C-terminal sorting domain